MSVIKAKKRGPRKAVKATKEVKPLKPARMPSKARKTKSRSKGTGGRLGSLTGAVLPQQSAVSRIGEGEILAFPARLLDQLPRGFALRCVTSPLVDPSDVSGDFVIVTSRKRYAKARAEGVPAFTGAEWRAMASAAEHGRAGRRELQAWLRHKRATPSWELTKRVAFDAAFGCIPMLANEPSTFTVEDVLTRLHVDVVALEMKAHA